MAPEPYLRSGTLSQTEASGPCRTMATLLLPSVCSVSPGCYYIICRFNCSSWPGNQIDGYSMPVNQVWHIIYSWLADNVIRSAVLRHPQLLPVRVFQLIILYSSTYSDSTTYPLTPLIFDPPQPAHPSTSTTTPVSGHQTCSNASTLTFRPVCSQQSAFKTPAPSSETTSSTPAPKKRYVSLFSPLCPPWMHVRVIICVIN
jgi:hypothetical protein